jgi:protein-S-isoprenylcysteine O-methyltransferase Ste14
MISSLIRHLIAIVALPITAAVLVPYWLARRYVITYALPTNFQGVALQALGAGVLIVGLVLFTASLYNFATQGRGTLAPWDPPRQLVVRGPYRFVRNPMISGVIFTLLGEALLLESLPHAMWAALFIAINLIYIPLIEEPQLEARFGEPYQHYQQQVPRFLPRLHPRNTDGQTHR